MKVNSIKYVVGSDCDMLHIENDTNEIAVSISKIVTIRSIPSNSVEIRCVENERIVLEETPLSQVLEVIENAGLDEMGL